MLTTDFYLIAVADGQDSRVRRIECSPAAIGVDADNVQKQAAEFTLVETTGTVSGPFAAYLRVEVLAREAVLGADEPSGLRSAYTWRLPAAKWGTATAVRLTAYDDAARTSEAATLTVPLVRDTPLPYPAGDWSAAATYKNGHYVLHDGKVYMWRDPVAGNSALDPLADVQQNPDTTAWTAYEQWTLLATSLLLADYALLAGAVAAGKLADDGAAYQYAKMFSQTGRIPKSGPDITEKDWEETRDYRQFDPSKEADDPSQTWRPNACIDWVLGKFYGLAVNLRAGRIGGLEIQGDRLVNAVDESGIEFGNAAGRHLELGSRYSALISMRIDNNPNGDEGQTGLNIQSFGSKNVCIKLLANAGSKFAIDSIGPHRFYQRNGEVWDMPGVLWAGRVEEGGNLSSQWGNGAGAVKVSRTGTGMYRIYHDVTHLQFFATVACNNYSEGSNGWMFGMVKYKVAAKADSVTHEITEQGYIDINTVDTGNGNRNTSFDVVLCGRNTLKEY